MTQTLETATESNLYSKTKENKKQTKVKRWLEGRFAPVGIEINGDKPWDPQIHDSRFYDRLFREGSVGAGESYMDGWWDCVELDELFNRLLSAKLDVALKTKWAFIKHILVARILNLQNQKRAWQVGEAHYDAGNDLYQLMLDDTMAYSCGYWQEADNLHQAQIAKLDLVCRKAQLQKGERVLDIGCGWGSFSQYAAQHYSVDVTGITISKEQQQLAQERCKGLPVDIQLKDYRSLKGKFDKLISIGMFEHVGPKNYSAYMKSAHNLMKDEGIFVLHTIGSAVSQQGTDPWIHKYIFPNGAIPSLTQISQSCEPYFVIEDVHNFGPDYDRTLMNWQHNFEQSWAQIKHLYSERFYRMWNYYLKTCAGAFRCRNLQLFQLVLRKRHSQLPRYSSPR
ncbi:cyclopropane fatty acyl phospholipid synthase [Alteromonas pelagimontana]|uniref:Cyclopropane fatty acyl phospholipid synthase n=1 Tax=Alteromonas pelagimontana TaxID=1858656 RepID=A0A6M4MBD1_9ALTE|nr:cyclopropane fatty acyl phospholipid synthase [Alteromonas pelagimontana]QJR80501.1 cyclopropane fatty acyl phospholipid synthase [Alteromonas pelagimontana]